MGTRGKNFESFDAQEPIYCEDKIGKKHFFYGTHFLYKEKYFDIHMLKVTLLVMGLFYY